MKNNRILITTYQSAFLKAGGGEIELKNIVKYLKNSGMQADIYGSSSLTIDAYDIIIHFSIMDESYCFLEELKLMGKTIILWPNIWWSHPPNKDKIFASKAFFRLADVVIFKSKSELENISKYLELDKIKYEIIPWYVDKKYLNNVKEGLFKNIYNLDKYILSVGIIEPNKKQLDIVKAIKGIDIDIKIVFVGNHTDNDYFLECIKEGGEKTLFIPFMEPSSDILRSAYKDCSVYIEISNEPAGLSALEAGLFNKPMILSNNEWSIEHFQDMIALVNSESNILSVVKSALEGNYKFSGRRKIISKHVGLEKLTPLMNILQQLEKANIK